MYKQIIIVRKDLNLSPGKLSAQVSHASMAFINQFIENNIGIDGNINAQFDKDIFKYWMGNGHTKCVLRAKNKTQLLKAKTMAEELGLIENKDFWLIRDRCYTELEPEENGTTLTVIGFRPMDDELADKIGKKFQLY